MTPPPLRPAGALADDFYLIAHSETGEPRLSPRVTGLALAGSLLCELALRQAIDVREGWVVVVESGSLDNPLADRILGQLRQETRPVRDWLAYLAQSAEDGVAGRMTAGGVLTRQPSRLPWRGDRWVPASRNVAAVPAAILCTKLIRREPLTIDNTVLLGLTLATGLDQHLLWEVRDGAPQALADLDDALGRLPLSLRELLGQTEAAVGAAIASHRA
jgi:Golgi phosphoprotein 3 (GPP34)